MLKKKRQQGMHPWRSPDPAERKGWAMVTSLKVISHELEIMPHLFVLFVSALP